MRFWILSLIALLPLAAAADTSSDLTAARRLESALEGLSGFRASFRQTVTDASGQEIE